MAQNGRDGARSVELLSVDMANMGGSEWTVQLLATRRKDGSLTLKVHQRSVDYGLEYRYRSRPIRTAEAFISSWMEAIEVGYLVPGDRAACVQMLIDEALPVLTRLHPSLAERIRAHESVAPLLAEARCASSAVPRPGVAVGDLLDELVLAEVVTRREGQRALSGAVFGIGGAFMRTADLLARCATELASVAAGRLPVAGAQVIVRETYEARSDLEAWLDEEIAFYEVADYEGGCEFIRGESAAYAALRSVVRAAGGCTEWLHPDTGEKIGEIREVEGMTSDDTLMVRGHAALSCLQWAADLRGVPARIEVVGE